MPTQGGGSEIIMKTKNRTAYKNKYLSENYDRIYLTVPKGKKAIIENAAKRNSMSVNSYILSLIDRELNISKPSAKKEDMEIFLF